MYFLYVLLQGGEEWEDLVIFETEEEAIRASIKNPNARVEIFRKNTNSGYTPTYNYYKNGELVNQY